MERPLVLITGGARRVGKGIALHLARVGYEVTFTYHRSAEDAESLEREIGARGYRVDSLDPKAVEGFAKQIVELGRPIAGLVNNASIYLPDDPADPTRAARMWKVHFEVPLLLARLLGPQLKAGHGCIVNMCDILGERPMPGWLGYCASKAAMANLTLGLARELAPEVRVNGIAPGVVEWPDDYPQEEREKYLKRVPLGRAGTPEDVAKMVEFVLGDGAYVTGQILRLDGGRSIG